MIKHGDKTFQFLTSIVSLGNVKLGSGPHIVKFPFQGDISLIEEFVPLCGCTAQVRAEGNNIIAEYTNYDKETDLKDGFLSMDKQIKVFFTDGKPLKKLNPKGIPVYNDEKEHEFLTIKLIVTK